MYHTQTNFKEEKPLDSGLGESFGPDVDVECLKSFTELEVSSGENQQNDIESENKELELLRQAFTPDEDNDTYLHLFIARGDEERSLKLIDMCPKLEYLDIQNHLGQTAMHVGTFVNLQNVVSKLIHTGADIGRVDKDGKNIFHLCAERGHIETLEAIVRAVCEKGLIDQMNILLNERDFSGLTPFFLAVSNKQVKLCQKLTELEVDVNLSDAKSGNTPLHEAVIDSDYSDAFAQFLINHCHVDVNSQNYAGVTVLHCAAGRDNVALFTTLLLSGADPNITDIKGNTPSVYGNEKIQLLVNSNV